MEPFRHLDGIAMPMGLANVDTDQIIPARFLWRPRGDGYEGLLFHDLRFEEDGSEKEGFILNRSEYRQARIIVADRNFGCGSSREAAVWTLYDHGIRAVIAASFGDIFFNNSMKNGLLPIRLPREICDLLMADAAQGDNARLTIDLAAQVVVRPNGEEIHFEMDPLRKHLLLNGLDDIGQTLQHAPAIDRYETARQAAQPWFPTTTLTDPAP